MKTQHSVTLSALFHSAGIRTDRLLNMEYKIICTLRSLKYTFWDEALHLCYKKLRSLKVYSVRMNERNEQTNEQMKERRKEERKKERKKERKEGQKKGKKEERM